MATVYPTMEKFLYWYNKWKNKECSKDYARQMVPFKQTQWYYVCKDYEEGNDISKYFTRRNF